MNAKIPDEEAATPNGANHPAVAKTKKTTHRRYRPEQVVRQPHTYWVQFRRKDTVRTKRYLALNPGQAYFKCHRDFPSAELLDAWRQSDCPGESAVTHYPVPSVIQITPGPGPKEKQTEFGFLEEISLNGVGIATTGLAA